MVVGIPGNMKPPDQLARMQRWLMARSSHDKAKHKNVRSKLEGFTLNNWMSHMDQVKKTSGEDGECHQ